MFTSTALNFLSVCLNSTAETSVLSTYLPARLCARAHPDVSSHLPISVSRSFKPVSYPQLDPHQCVSNLSPLSKNQTSPPERTNILGGFGKTLICAALSDVTDLPGSQLVFCLCLSTESSQWRKLSEQKFSQQINGKACLVNQQICFSVQRR